MTLTYEQMLDKLYKSLPERKTSGERFENPTFDSVTEGTKTIIRNMDVVCQKIRRTPEEVTKYLLKELATPGVYAQGKLTVQRKIFYKLLNDKLADYIKTHVICHECGKPDTHIESLDRGLKILVCEACGARSPIRT